MPARNARHLKFPVIRRIEVHGYPMYPGNGEGLKHEFQPGVNAIVGINGLGKTTLLNILLRMIVGAFDPRKADILEPGAKLHELTTLTRFGYFASRIGADARSATATIEMSFGKDRITVARDLGPKLEIKELWHNKAKQIASSAESLETRYWELVGDLSGIRSQYDFDFVVRNLLFFLEDKVPLIWNPKGQFEILRILFLDDELSAESARLHDAVMQLDSRYRNRLWSLNRLREEHGQAQARVASAPEQVVTLEAARTAFSASEMKLEQLEAEFLLQSSEVEELRAQLFVTEQKANECARTLESIEINYLRRVFPDMSERAELLFGALLNGGGCPMCGTESQHAAEKIKGLIASLKCPCCESPLGQRSKVTSVAGFDNKRMKEAGGGLKAAVAEIDKLSGRLKQLEEELNETREALYAAQRDRADLAHRVRTLESNLPPGDEDFERLRQGLRREEAEVEALKQERIKRQSEYDFVLDKARDRIATIADGVVQNFQRYAKSFLIETSELSYALSSRAVGQSGPLMSFPTFVLKMSSNAAPTASVRGSADQVSESQKEFVDLAFRMAVLEVCAKRAGAGMLVIETPEASLDSVFISRAGRLLSAFAAEGDDENTNVVIASTNLNKENMLGWLLGITGTVKSEKRKESIRKRIINLLSVAAPTSAYRANKKIYDKALEDAIGFPP